ncbi:PREDICTED: uncharacterized protein LOC106815629 [Priapulus caudatus]|uniref:RNA-directed DNA polymerase n=1 Tax=Priapulus caudatus TaxID=37621 RepID=A0ABM1ETT3_PRICU|nr:PREDICTED: uncharacterized protein LOC106815629 [Priapulus caudatus]
MESHGERSFMILTFLAQGIGNKFLLLSLVSKEGLASLPGILVVKFSTTSEYHNLVYFLVAFFKLVWTINIPTIFNSTGISSSFNRYAQEDLLQHNPRRLPQGRTAALCNLLNGAAILLIMATTMIGAVGPYEADAEGFDQYAERVNLFMEANGIKDDVKVQSFLAIIGASAYGVLKSMCSPDLPRTKTVDQLIDLLRKHYDPRPLVIVERFRFMKRTQRDSENISQFVTELKRLSTHCEFGTTLLERLRDQFVVGLKAEAIQRRLLAERELTFDRAVQVAHSMETAAKDCRELIGAAAKQDNKVQFVSRKPAGGGKPRSQQTWQKPTTTYCYRCGKPDHKADTCIHKDTECSKCHKKGHLKRVCRSTWASNSDNSKSGSTSSQTPRKKGYGQKGRVYNVQGTDSAPPQEVPSGEEVYDSHLYHIRPGTRANSRSTPAFMSKMTINGVDVAMEIDTGAAATLISERTYRELLAEWVQLNPTACTLRTYTGEPLAIAGTCVVQVEYNGQRHELPLLVVQGNGPSLLGRDWLCEIKLDWKKVCRSGSGSAQGSRGAINRVTCVQEILEKYPEVMEDGLGTLKGVKGHVQVDSDAEPQFFKARNVPYALREKVDTELDRLEREGIIESVPFSDWAAPIVPVVKPDKSVRICGDFKVTVNRYARVEKYPLPRVEDLYAKLSGGQKFTKLDLRQAYFQIELDEGSKKYVTINTAKGLFRYNRLLFGVSSAPAIFQRIMDQLVGDTPFVVARLDDILISGRDDEEHLRNLEEVLRRLAEVGLRLNRAKCIFMADEVIYLGYKISADGLHTVAEKVKAIAMAPQPKNVKELRSYLGCLNYYAKFMPNLSTELEPLHRLLKQDNRFVWGNEQDVAFRRSKELLQSASVLVHYDPDKELILACDASPYGVGAVLAHRLPDGTERPISFASRTLAAAERNYSQLEKEALAIVWAVKYFHCYLYGRAFGILSDHKPLESLLGEQKPIPPLASGRIQRWGLMLSAYQYELKYKSGAKMANADAMSRLPLPTTVREVPTPAETVCLLEFMDSSPVDVELVRTMTDKDIVLSRVRRLVRHGWPESKKDGELLPYYVRRDELSIQDGCILWGSRVIVPTAARERVMYLLHEGHPGIVRMKVFARQYMVVMCAVMLTTSGPGEDRV